MKKIKGLLAGGLICTIFASGVVFAKQATESISVIYDNIKILIDGKEYQPTDANGNIVEPFIYNGTTYLPVRAIANAFDKEVDWEPQTSTVTLGGKNYDWLDQMGYVEYNYSAIGNSIGTIPSDTKSSDNIKYDRGIMLYLYDYTEGMWGNGGTVENDYGSLECYENVSYLLNNNYKAFEGTISCFSDEYARGTAVIKMYGDGNLLYTSPIICHGMKSTKINLDVENVKLLKISIEMLNVEGNRKKIDCGIADARLLKDSI